MLLSRIQFSSNPGLIAVRSPLLVITTAVLSINTRITSLTRENKIDYSKTFGLRRLHRLYVVRAEPPFLLLDHEE